MRKYIVIIQINNADGKILRNERQVFFAKSLQDLTDKVLDFVSGQFCVILNITLLEY